MKNIKLVDFNQVLVSIITGLCRRADGCNGPRLRPSQGQAPAASGHCALKRKIFSHAIRLIFLARNAASIVIMDTSSIHGNRIRTAISMGDRVVGSGLRDRIKRFAVSFPGELGAGMMHDGCIPSPSI